MCHFMPGTLGDFITEKEKQQIILQNYGEIIYNEYKKSSKINIVREPTIAHGSDPNTEQKQIIISEGKNSKKRIIPIAEKTFSSELDPHNFKFIFKEFNRTASLSEGKNKLLVEETKVQRMELDENEELIVTAQRLNEETKGERQMQESITKQKTDQTNSVQNGSFVQKTEEKFIIERENK